MQSGSTQLLPLAAHDFKFGMQGLRVRYNLMEKIPHHDEQKKHDGGSRIFDRIR
jgi:hypothetical protein